VLVTVVSVTRKGQATIPKALREKYGIKDKALITEEDGKIVLKPVPTPDQDIGSLRGQFKGRSSRELLAEARREESMKEKKLERHARATRVRL